MYFSLKYSYFHLQFPHGPIGPPGYPPNGQHFPNNRMPPPQSGFFNWQNMHYSGQGPGQAGNFNNLPYNQSGGHQGPPMGLPPPIRGPPPVVGPPPVGGPPPMGGMGPTTRKLQHAWPKTCNGRPSSEGTRITATTRLFTHGCAGKR